MSFFTKLFGGESKSGLKYQQAENNRAREYAKEQANLGVSQINRLYPQASQRFEQGFADAQNTLSSLPAAQIDPLQQASMQAQNTLLGGMDAYRAAILGMPYQMPQAQQINTQQALMPFQRQFAPPAMPEQQTAPPPMDFSQYLSGYFGGGRQW